ncbi:unnamed protein product [Cercospora beticola]|nr:unnamed protein product [Cercospora beticola]
MARILTFLLAITFALAVLASSSPSCSNGHYTPLLALIGNDAKTRTFCASLPPRSRFKQNQCPSALRRLAYQEIKEFCACFHATCKAPRCRGVTPDCCDKYPCGKLCTNKQTSNEHCGKCNRKCGSYQKCARGQCKPTVTTTTTTSTSATTSSTTTSSTTTSSTTTSSTTTSSTTTSSTTTSLTTTSSSTTTSSTTTSSTAPACSGAVVQGGRFPSGATACGNVASEYTREPISALNGSPSCRDSCDTDPSCNKYIYRNEDGGTFCYRSPNPGSSTNPSFSDGCPPEGTTNLSFLSFGYRTGCPS